MLNIERMNEFIEYLKKLPTKQFDMTEWGTKTHCGTSACIAGHATAYFDQEAWHRYVDTTWFERTRMTDRQVARFHPSDVGRRVLGLTKRQADWLFDPWSSKWMEAKRKYGHRNADQKKIAIMFLEEIRDKEIARRQKATVKNLLNTALKDPEPVSLFADNEGENSTCNKETQGVGSR